MKFKALSEAKSQGQVMLNYIRKALIRLLGGYDAAERTAENRKQWKHHPLDVFPSITNTPVVRQRLRLSAQYEDMNSCYCGGMLSTLARDTIGITGPTLQMMTEDRNINSQIETDWRKWSDSEDVSLANKLNILDRARRTDGEGFILFINDDSQEFESLNVHILPAMRVANYRYQYPYKTGDIVHDDGVSYNERTGKVQSFEVTTESLNLATLPTVTPVSPRYMKQWFMPKRPEQIRGVCEIAAALPLFSFLRRYTLAVLGSAEFAASMSGVLETQAPPTGDTPNVPEFTEIEFVRNTLLSLPEGWKANAFKGEQPTNTYGGFVDCVLREIGRVLDVPFGVVAGDSSRYNYSSARLDYRGYDDRIKLDRKVMNTKIINPIFAEWLIEYLVSHKDMQRVVNSPNTYFNWRYTGRASIDPLKEARADQVRLQTLTSTLAEIYGERGLDWEEELEQRKKENEKLEELGIVLPPEVATPIDPAEDIPETQQTAAASLNGHRHW